jgi:type III pantothenate kinase
VGAIRTLVERQAKDLSPRPWVVWSGGDALLLMGSSALDLPDARLAPSLVLDGLRVACEA